jgi:putative transposase
MIPCSIASIIKGFKIGVTKWCRNNTNIDTIWQRNYYDQIIRDDHSFQNISQHIADNPKKWNNDRLFI